jgi:hypothetical protein
MSYQPMNGYRPLLLASGLLVSSIAIGQQDDATDRLVQAAHVRDLSAMVAALHDGASVNKPGKSTGGPNLLPALVHAVDWRDTDAVRLLLESGAEPNTAINYATCDAPGILKMLLDHGADPNYGKGGGGSTSPLAGTVVGDDGSELQTHCLQSAQLLIDRGANIDGIGDGHPPLIVAVDSHRLRFIEFFLSKGANVNIRGTFASPIMEAIYRYAFECGTLPCPRDASYFQTISLLLKHHADPNVREGDMWYDAFKDHYPDTNGYTALGVAAHYGWYDLAKLLLDHGADPTIPRADGCLPEILARESGHAATAALIASSREKWSHRW